MKQSIPYYFVTVHNEPHNEYDGLKKIERDYKILEHYISEADKYNIKLTVMLSVQWVDYILADDSRVDNINIWRMNGHEIGAHHHSIYHEDWDGFTDYAMDKVIKIRTQLNMISKKIIGTMDDYISKLKLIAPDLKSGCMNDEADKDELPDDIVYDTCSGFANFGRVGSRLSDYESEYKAVNEYILVGNCKGIRRKWLSHYQITNEERQKAAQQIFNKVSNCICGVITHSVPKQADYFYLFLNFLHMWDSSGKRSKTLTEIIEQKLLPEIYIPDDLISTKYFSKFGC